MNDVRPKRVLLVDDDLVPMASEPGGGNYMWYYSQAFRDNGFYVEEVNSVDKAIELLENVDLHFDLIVLDVMMSPGNAFAHEGGDAIARGLRTGFLMADRIEQICPGTPVVVLSLRNYATIKQLEEKPNVKRVFMKRKYPPFQFVNEVKKVLEE